MGSSAEVEEVAVAIEADLVAGVSEFGDEVGLHEVAVAFEFGERVFAEIGFAGEFFVACDDLGHFGLDGGEVVWGEGFFAVEVVEESRIGGWAVSELGFREKLKDGGGHDVGGGVAHDFEGFGIAFFQESEAGIFKERRGEVDKTWCGSVAGGVHGGIAFGFVGGLDRCAGGDRSEAGYDGSGGEAGGDCVGDVIGGGARGYFADCPVGEIHGDGFFAHDEGSFLKNHWMCFETCGNHSEYTGVLRNKHTGEPVLRGVGADPETEWRHDLV